MSNRIRRRAFTLVEIMVVVVIIGLLVGILVPALSAVRKAARESSSRATLGILQTGLETFRADQTLGGAYPPSASDGDATTATNNMPKYQVRNPYSVGSSRPNMEISGAGLLVWALAGADLLGTPGFKPVRPNSSAWSRDTDAEVNTTDTSKNGLYALDETTLQPLRPRVGPFVDLSKIRTSTRSGPVGAVNVNFAIDAEVKAFKDLGQQAPQRQYPMFLDGFGHPILYWRADPAGILAVDNQPPTDPKKRGIYHFLDNGPLLANSSDLNFTTAQTPLRLNADDRSTPSNLRMKDAELADGKVPTDFDDIEFAQFIRNRDVTAKLQPHNAQGFLLITPGADGVYGTGDDIANFDHSGGEIKID